ncbi:S41 family peptidase [Clostridium sp. B9]|uniref:S41 family peptidase n=1 Tax=Clostridium sp. B9 TaxID=3423224 RepID=UPI003D2F1F2B
MGEKNSEYGHIKKVILVAIPVILIVLGGLFYYHNNFVDDEFNQGSNIKIETLDGNEVESLNKLCKVWGNAKYYHPKVIEGNINWDFELFRVMPEVIAAETQEEVNTILYEWINNFGEFEEGSYSESNEVKIEADTEWINDEEYLGQNLSSLLVKMSKSYIYDRDNAYVNYKDGSIFSNFDKEELYPVIKYDDDGYKLLSLFRYWNIIEYYYPYKNIMDEDWNEVLNEFIPKMVQCDDELSYKLTLAELTTRIHDSHAAIYDNAGTLRKYFGENIVPIQFLLVEDKVVVTDIIDKYLDECSLQVGDVVLEINGREVFEVINEKGKYISFSRDEAMANGLNNYLFRTSEDSMELTIERDGKELVEDVKCYDLNEVYKVKEERESHKILDKNIGYVNLGALAKDEIHEIMKKFESTEGMIVDLREYPSDMVTYTMPNYLLPEETVFSRATIANKAKPGEFIFVGDITVGKNNPDYYKGNIVIIINERTQSNGEFTAMALRKAPNATVIGENSIGADGNVANINLPGGVITTITGIGIYTPETSETQRVGIEPDIYVKPTIQGIRDGKDELLDYAIELIK